MHTLGYAFCLFSSFFRVHCKTSFISSAGNVNVSLHGVGVFLMRATESKPNCFLPLVVLVCYCPLLCCSKNYVACFATPSQPNLLLLLLNSNRVSGVFSPRSKPSFLNGGHEHELLIHAKYHLMVTRFGNKSFTPRRGSPNQLHLQ